MLRALSSAVALLLCAALTASSTASSTASGSPPQRDEPRTGYSRLVPPKTTVAQDVPFDLSGHVSTKRVKREVKLQQKVRRGTWRSFTTTTTDRRGRFTFEDVALSSTARLRGRLPAHATRVPREAGGPRTLRILPETTTKTLLIKVHPPQGRLSAMPAVNQQGPAPEAPRNDSVVSAWFDPPAPGRRVLLERLDVNGEWVPHATLLEDAAGFAVFNVPPAATYRATAQPFHGLASVRTNRASAVAKSLLFEDTFDAPTMDPRWRDFVLPRGYPGSQRTCAIAHPSQHSVGEGVLRMGIGYDPTLAGQECRYETAEGTKSGPYLYQSQLATRETFRFTHGIAAARIKFARASGRHSGFWIQVGFKVPGDPARGTEIDAVEFFGDNGGTKDRIGSFLHYYAADNTGVTLGQFWQAMAAMKPPGDTWWDSFHVFSVAWTPTEYVFRVDGHEFYREDRAISTTPQWLVLSSNTSDYELKDVTPENIDEETQVDWVRVWTL